MTNENAEWTVENKPTYEELAERLAKAEGKIVSLKSEKKEETKEDKVVNTDEAPKEEPKEEEPKEEAKTDNQETKTNELNEVEALRKELEALKADKAIESNVETTNMMSITWTPKPATTSEYTKADLERMTQSEYNEAKARIDSGDAKLII